MSSQILLFFSLQLSNGLSVSSEDNQFTVTAKAQMMSFSHKSH